MTDHSAHRPEVLFVCVHNAGRSQMAAALLAHHAGGRVVVRSAGTAPAESINPSVVAVMAELGIDLHAVGAHPKKLDDAAVQASDVVITMGCGDNCPSEGVALGPHSPRPPHRAEQAGGNELSPASEDELQSELKDPRVASRIRSAETSRAK